MELSRVAVQGLQVSERPREIFSNDPGCLHEIFEMQAELTPTATALICDERRFSYRELDALSNRLARHLRARGAGRGRFVAVYFERSERPIISILACLKSGATYVPIDPSYPAERIRHIVGETGLALVLTESSLSEQASRHFGEVPLLLVNDSQNFSSESGERLSRSETGLSPSDLCYVIYTSGTTGKPKGVMTEHRGAYQYTQAFNEVCGTTTSDRVFQGFSLSFDGSIEEMWMAFSNGSALVTGNRGTPRFGNELGQFLAKSGVTYFSTVPTLLTTITDGVATLRTLVVSGEICPPELVNRWARPGLRMLNVYGPTEATVNTTAFECKAGAPITIGTPLRGYGIHILDPDLRPVSLGERGELFVSGGTLARGYLNRPDLTEERFVSVSGLRLYRTGDLVRYNEQGNLDFFGRIDSQVKIRGYRVELAEIEAILLEDARVRSVSVKLFERDGLQELAAYVVLGDPSKPIDRAELLARVETRVPPYMVPGYLDVLDELPTLVSGKVDRSRLPTPTAPLLRVSAQRVPPETLMEFEVESVWAKVFGLTAVSIDDDFFLALGGHSLLAAQMVTQLRAGTRRRLTVRDAYSYPTIRQLSAHLETLPAEISDGHTHRAQAAPTSRSVFESVPRSTRLTVHALQAASIYLLYGVVSMPAVMTFLVGLDWIRGEISLGRMIAWAAWIVLLTWPITLALSVAAKWLIIGRYKPGRYPLWGSYFFRWWLVNRLQGLSGASFLAGTPLLPLYYRLMGARVGKRCTLDSALCSAWDLVLIGDDTSIGSDTQLLGYRVENGTLVLGGIEIGSRCFVGIHSALGLETRMGNDARLDDQSLLPDRAVIGNGESRRGSPARPANVAVPSPIRMQTSTRRALFGFAHFALIYVMAILFIIPLIPYMILWYHAFEDYSVTLGFVALLASVPASVFTTCLAIAAIKRSIINRARPGTYAIDSAFYLRKWLSDGIMKAARAALLPVYTTLYFPTWLRLLGAKIGPRAELSTVWNFAPELVDVGAESFFADGAIIGGRRVNGGAFEIGVNRIGRRSFVGNSAILPVGKSLGDGCLLGVQSAPPADLLRTPDRTDWLGSPSFPLPRRQKVEGFADAVTFQPTFKLYAQRALIDALRILIPGYVTLGAAVAGVTLSYEILVRFGLVFLIALAPLVGIALGQAAILVVVALKWAVMGKFKPVIQPLWSKYVWLNEMVNGAYESLMGPAIAPFLGTPFIAIFLRLIGCRIGKHAYIETTLFSEFDLVQIGDYTALGPGAVIQNHLFEDRIMKSSYLRIGDECTVGNMAVVLYDSEMQTGAWLGPLSLLMKGETLATGTRWHGIPTVQASEPGRAASEARTTERDFQEGMRRGLRRKSAAGAPTKEIAEVV